MKKYLDKFQSYEPFTIVLIGSSITSQEWCHPNWTDWLNYTLRQDEKWDLCWKRKIINTARDGATIRHFIDHLETEVLSFQPDLVIESLGLNSLVPRFDKNKTYLELKELNAMIIRNGIELATWSYLIGNNKFYQDLSALRDIQQRVASELNYQFVDVMVDLENYNLSKIFTFISPWGNTVWGIKTGEVDFLHCNEVGNQIIAKSLIEKLFNYSFNPEPFGTMKLLNLNHYLKQSSVDKSGISMV